MPNKLFSVQGYLGFRIPNHDFCRELSEAFEGPIITTSVNFSGKAPMNNIKSINDQFGNEIKLMISDPILDSSTKTLSSTVVMISKDESLKVLREGVVSVESINQALQ
jgi:L-threonylcarbamoyladenylate synthase